MGGHSLRAPTVDIPGQGGICFDFGGIFIKKAAWLSAPCDGPSRPASNAAIESFWRCLFVEIWLFS